MIWYAPTLLQLQACSFFKHGNSGNKSVHFATNATIEQASNTTSLVLLPQQNNTKFFTEAAAKPSAGILKVRQSLFRYVEKHKRNCFCWPKHPKKIKVHIMSFFSFYYIQRVFICGLLQLLLVFYHNFENKRFFERWAGPLFTKLTFRTERTVRLYILWPTK